jgi:AcrR family transcriptional regulator
MTSPPARGEKRRHDILRTAAALFNANSAAATSTNHIAAALEISVGNLYHHFRDKESIVRELFEEHHRKHDGVWTPPETRQEAASVAVTALRRAFGIAWQYRFLYRELVSLTRADPSLRKLYTEARAQRRDEIRAFQRAFIGLGTLRLPDDEATLAHLEDLSWMITTFWLPHVELRDGALTKRAALQGARAVLGLYVPFGTPAFASQLAAAFERVEQDT